MLKLQLIENAKKLTPKQVKSDLIKFLLKLDEVFFDLNIKQLEQGEGFDDKPLINSNRKYSGVYSKTTELIAKQENPLAPKEAGKLYNFLYSGDFINNFNLFQKGETLEWFSTGTGSGSKKSFFEGYKNLYGLNEESRVYIIENFLHEFLKKYYLTNLLK